LRTKNWKFKIASMRIKSLKLTNWRNFLDKKIDFNSKVFIVGKNGQGKTNILEAIYFLSTTKSFRTNNNFQLINWHKDLCRVEGKISIKENPDIKIELVINRNPQRKFQKRAKINNVPKKLIDVLGTLKVVLFSPEMIEIIYGSPVLRRRYLDAVLSITDHRYAKTLISFNQALKRRNKILSMIAEGKAKKDELPFWDQQIISDGSFVILRRLNLINFYNHYLPKAYQDLSNDLRDKLRLKYLNSLLPDQQKITQKEIIKNYQKMLVAKRDREIEFGTTLSGPQRDEIIFVLNNRSISSFGSRGECRSAILATKIVEIDYLVKKSAGDKPIMLLDDVFSELDEERRTKLAKTISGIQAIITTTDLSHIEKNLYQKAKIIKL